MAKGTSVKLRERVDWLTAASFLVGLVLVLAAVALYEHASTSCWGGECQRSQYDQPVERR